MQSEIREIFDFQEPPESDELSRDVLFESGSKPKKFQKRFMETVKRPEGMRRELFALLYSDNKDAAPLYPVPGQGYKRTKLDMSVKSARSWKWMPFTNPARKDNAVFHHWRRTADEGKDYPFAKFNKKVFIRSYTDLDYQRLHSSSWSREETDHLFDLCRRFDLRFTVIHDRWNREKFKSKTIEELKERYYEVCNLLQKIHPIPGQDSQAIVYDADHERRRKEQLKILFERTPDLVEEEGILLGELRKIEARKKDRERKTQDLDKLMASEESEMKKGEKKTFRRKVPVQKVSKLDVVSSDAPGIKFPDVKGSGVTMRSQRMKLPTSVGQRKGKIIEQLLQKLNIDLNPTPTEEICVLFNDLRSDIVLLYDLRLALSNCEFELQTLKHQYEVLSPGSSLEIPPTLIGSSSSGLGAFHDSESPGTNKAISEIIDVNASPSAANRKRKAALEQSNVLKKIKNRM